MKLFLALTLFLPCFLLAKEFYVTPKWNVNHSLELLKLGRHNVIDVELDASPDGYAKIIYESRSS